MAFQTFHIATVPEIGEIRATAPQMAIDAAVATCRVEGINPRLASDHVANMVLSLLARKIEQTEAFIGRPMTQPEALAVYEGFDAAWEERR